MEIRKVLLPLQPAATAAATFSAAVMIARFWRAHLAVLHAADNRDRETATRHLFERLAAEHGLVVAEARPDAGEAGQLCRDHRARTRHCCGPPGQARRLDYGAATPG